MLRKTQINQVPFPPVSKSQLMFSSPKFVSTSSYNNVKGERNYNQFLSYNHKRFKSIQYKHPYNSKVKKVIPITNIPLFTLGGFSTLSFPPLLLPTIPTARMKPKQ